MIALLVLLAKLAIGLYMAMKLVLVALAGVFVGAFGSVIGARQRSPAGGEEAVGAVMVEAMVPAGDAPATGVGRGKTSHRNPASRTPGHPSGPWRRFTRRRA